MVEIDLRAFGGSALTDAQIQVPKDRADLGDSTEIPVTYVPARNTIFLSYALAWAEVLGAFDIFIGVNSTDYSGYPDCRPEFIAAFEQMANLATAAAVQGKGRFRIHTPIIHMTKAQIIQAGTKLGVDYSLTHSCYDPGPAGPKLRPVRLVPAEAQGLCRGGTCRTRLSTPMRVSEIFYSLQGEGMLVGTPSVFVRLAGCPFRCRWCDTAYAWDYAAGEDLDPGQIVEHVNLWPCRFVVLTGGEPLTGPDLAVRPGLVDLSHRLQAAGKHITIETSGVLFVPDLACDLMSISPKLTNAAHHGVSRERIRPTGSTWRRYAG